MDAVNKIMEEEILPVSKLSFQQVRGLFKKNVPPEEANPPVQLMSIKNIGDSLGGKITQEFFEMERRPSSVVRRMNVLASHIRAARYVLVLVLTLFISWAPTLFYDVYAITKQENDFDPNGKVNRSEIFECFEAVISGDGCSTDTTIGCEFQKEYEKIIRHFSNIEEAGFHGVFFAVNFSLINCMFNPVLYAFWYPEFRTYFTQMVLEKKRC